MKAGGAGGRPLCPKRPGLSSAPHGPQTYTLMALDKPVLLLL